MSLASLVAYGSGSEESDDETPAQHSQLPKDTLSLPAPQLGNDGVGVASDAKRPRRSFQLPLPAPKHSVQASDGESSDDEDAKRFAASRKGGGLLASVSHLAQHAARLAGVWRVSA